MQVPVSTPRKVARTVCKTVVDITTIEDCQVDIYTARYLISNNICTQETVTTECTQTSTKVAHSSAVVGHDTKVS